MSNNGGKRPGAGRKKGHLNKVNAEIKERLVKSKKTPLEVMTAVMCKYWDAAERMAPGVFLVVDKELVTSLSLYEKACEMASKAAPYMHAKLQNIEHQGEGGGPIQQRIIVEFVKAHA